MADELINTSNRNLKKAHQIMDELKIQEIWEGLNSTCNLVGSVKTGLLLHHLDIDFHTYSDTFSIEDSFKAISMICRSPKIKEVTYLNLLEEDDMCLEWHLSYEENPDCFWTIDIIHIKNESPYAGMIERVTERIMAVLNSKLKETILEIKQGSWLANEKYPAIEIYQAVIEDKIKTFEEFKEWRKSRNMSKISLWEPNLP